MVKKLRQYLDEINSDHGQLSQEDHELIYNLLDNFGCRSTKDNQENLTKILRDFKDSKGSQYTQDYEKEEFYAYAKQHKLFKKLEKKK